VERFVGKEVLIAFQLPGASAGDWATKQLPVQHDELRWIQGLPSGYPTFISVQHKTEAAAVPMFQDTALPTNWVAEELLAYDSLFKEAASAKILDAQSLAEYFQHSQLPRRILDEILQVANPDLKPDLGLDEFRSCCRLIGHCQTLAKHDKLCKGRRALRSELRSHCLGVPSPTLPTFDAPLPCTEHVSS